VKEAVYDCDWFDTPTSFKRSMGIIILRANQTINIKVGGFIVLDLPSFYDVSNKEQFISTNVNTR
jgi:7tm Odorant receptor